MTTRAGTAGGNNLCAVILAAGRGSRLAQHTDSLPKCLVEVAGRAILSRMLDELESHGVDEFIIVIGYRADLIRDHVARFHRDLDVTFVENPEYLQTGSVFSLALALERVPAHRNLLVVEGDVVLEPGLCQTVWKPLGANYEAATLLAAYKPELSGTFALIEGGRVACWTHESRRAANFPLRAAYKTVNITAVTRGDPVNRLRNAIRATILEAGRTAPLEYAMQSLVDGDLSIAAVVVGAARWWEVDTPEDLSIATELFASVAQPRPEAIV